MNEESDYGGKLVSDLIQIVEDELDIHRWQFQLSYTKLEKRSSQGFHVSLIYDSEWCRIQFQYGIVLGIPDAPGLLTRYGRLHAPHDTSIIVCRVGLKTIFEQIHDIIARTLEIAIQRHYVADN